MARLHTHSVFGQQYTHSTRFRHTSREDRGAHERELRSHRLSDQNGRPETGSKRQVRNSQTR